MPGTAALTEHFGGATMTQLLPTGITVLDRILQGGIPVGSIVSLVASPASQSELFLYELAGSRPTVYLSGARSKASVQSALDYYDVDENDVQVYALSGENLLERAAKHVSSLPDGAIVIFDPADALEDTQPAEYVAFLNDLKDALVEAKGFAVLHCLDNGEMTAGRVSSLYHSDAVFTLTTELREGEVNNRLSIPKFRGKRALNETLKLDLTESVTIDTTRNIF